MTFGFEKLSSKSGMPVIILVASATSGETCAPTGQPGIGFNLAIHVARECCPVTDEFRTISSGHHDSDLPSDDGSQFLVDVE